MGVEPFLVTASVNLVLAQRLARTHLRRLQGAGREARPRRCSSMGMTAEQIGRGDASSTGAGCKTCNDTGYKGRVALYEVMPFTDELKELVLQGASTAEIKAEMIRDGHADPAHGRHQQDPRGRDHARRGPAHHRRRLTAGAAPPAPHSTACNSPCTSCSRP